MFSIEKQLKMIRSHPPPPCLWGGLLPGIQQKWAVWFSSMFKVGAAYGLSRAAGKASPVVYVGNQAFPHEKKTSYLP